MKKGFVLISTLALLVILSFIILILSRTIYSDTLRTTIFASSLEKVCVETVESGSMTKDLAILIDKSTKYLTTNQFLEAIDGNLKKKLN